MHFAEPSSTHPSWLAGHPLLWRLLMLPSQQKCQEKTAGHRQCSLPSTKRDRGLIILQNRPKGEEVPSTLVWVTLRSSLSKSCLKICVCWHASKKQVTEQQRKCVSIGIKGKFIQTHVNHTGRCAHTQLCRNCWKNTHFTNFPSDFRGRKGFFFF